MESGDCRYAKSHEWVKIQDDLAVVGISDHAQDSLGDVTYVELPAVGAKLEQGKECGVIESVKAASDLYSPVTGEVVEVNEALENAPELVNKDAHGEGWMFKVKGFTTAEMDELMDAAAYDTFLATES